MIKAFKNYQKTHPVNSLFGLLLLLTAALTACSSTSSSAIELEVDSPSAPTIELIASSSGAEFPGLLNLDLQASDLSFPPLLEDEAKELILSSTLPYKEYSIGLLSEDGMQLSCWVDSTPISETEVSLDLCSLDNPVFIHVSASFTDGSKVQYYFPIKPNWIKKDEVYESYEASGVFHDGGQDGITIVEDADTYFLDKNSLIKIDSNYAQWEGQKLLVQGTVLVHFCKEEASCPENGKVMTFTEISEVEVLE